MLPQRSGQSRRLTGRLYHVPGVPSCHALLLVKLPAIGVSDSLLGWPKDFLLGRRMKALRVVILSGVPQGSVVGPVLFCSKYINNIICGLRA